ncbi:MAG: hypothetical protein MUF49_17785 [Oculatellaceae cyanobacterium Prado106]|jgi:Ca2+-binding RTX toxin-like protein|nr:hypothetical protein [Oculatellaceae cyanobacterium Prado106]
MSSQVVSSFPSDGSAIPIVDDPSKPCPDVNPVPVVVDEFPGIFDTEINGTENADRLIGDDRSNGIFGQGGDDVLLGLGGADILDGGSGSDRILGGSGSDRLFGGEDHDGLSGGSGNDTLYGGAGNDRLLGGTGRDVLLGGSGTNTLVGGAGSDGFVLSLGFGDLDTIVDFQKGRDKLGLPDGVCFADLMIRQQGTDTVVEYTRAPLRIANDAIAVLQNVQASSITALDFASVIRAL